MKKTHFIREIKLRSRLTILLILASCLVYFACNQEQLKLNESQTEQLQSIERDLEFIKVKDGDATFEFSITRNHDGSIRIEKRQVDYDPNSRESGVFVKSDFITQTGNKSFKINKFGTVKHFYIPFSGGEPIEILEIGTGGSGGEFYCECEDPGDEWGGNICELERTNAGPFSRWICDGDCQDCDMKTGIRGVIVSGTSISILNQ